MNEKLSIENGKKYKNLKENLRKLKELHVIIPKENITFFRRVVNQTNIYLIMMNGYY